MRIEPAMASSSTTPAPAALDIPRSRFWEEPQKQKEPRGRKRKSEEGVPGLDDAAAVPTPAKQQKLGPEQKTLPISQPVNVAAVQLLTFMSRLDTSAFSTYVATAGPTTAPFRLPICIEAVPYVVRATITVKCTCGQTPRLQHNAGWQEWFRYHAGVHDLSVEHTVRGKQWRVSGATAAINDTTIDCRSALRCFYVDSPRDHVAISAPVSAFKSKDVFFGIRCLVEAPVDVLRLIDHTRKLWSSMESGQEGDVTFQTNDGPFKMWRAYIQDAMPLLRAMANSPMTGTERDDSKTIDLRQYGVTKPILKTLLQSVLECMPPVLNGYTISGVSALMCAAQLCMLQHDEPSPGGGGSAREPEDGWPGSSARDDDRGRASASPSVRYAPAYDLVEQAVTERLRASTGVQDKYLLRALEFKQRFHLRTMRNVAKQAARAFSGAAEPTSAVDGETTLKETTSRQQSEPEDDDEEEEDGDEEEE